MKNDTRISSLMGTWTAEVQMKDSGGNEMHSFVVLHFICDPLKGANQCELENCDEVDNSICLFEHTGGGSRCGSMFRDIADWSDALVFMYSGVDLNVPSHDQKINLSTGGWTGPYNLVLAQGTTSSTNGLQNSKVVDNYTLRYVQGPYTPFLRMDPECNLYDSLNFSENLGPIAINTTAQTQTTLLNGEDPYEEHLKTCAVGNIKPSLPMIKFEFSTSSRTQIEDLKVKLSYKQLIVADDNNNLQKILPTMKPRGFPISGPYCYNNNLKSWTVDIEFDSDKQSDTSLIHTCRKGLPCQPIDLEICSTCTQIEVNEADKVTSIQVNGVLVLSIIAGILSVALAGLFVWHVKLKKARRNSASISQDNTSEPSNDLELEQSHLEFEESDELRTPLISSAGVSA